ncbi:MAG: 3'-5' exonuclease [Oceanospirillaceae bacterium]|nr:3'-5' exonuclease [Oceanospirillaceae bacterium]
MPSANSLVVLDFETTGLSPNMGDRAIEIAGVRLENGEVTDSFQALMNPGQRVSGFIEDYTGITNAMLADAPACESVMAEFADFIGDANLVAHNASFDQRFLDAELARIDRSYRGEFVCSMLVARRIYQDAPNHQLGTLIKHAKIPAEGVFHRALYDTQMTAKLWQAMLESIETRYGITNIPFALLKKIARTPKKALHGMLEDCQTKH